MGFNGEIVVVRSQSEPKEIGPFIATQRHNLRGDWPLKGDWRALYVRPFAEPYEYDEAWLAEVSARTGAPVLACNVFESDVAHIRGLSGVGTWEFWLNLPYAAGTIVERRLEEVAGRLLDDEDPDAFGRYRDEQFETEYARLTDGIPAAARNAVTWAEQAGFTVPVEPVEELFKAPRETFIQWGFFKLLYRLGLRETDFDPDSDD